MLSGLFFVEQVVLGLWWELEMSTNHSIREICPHTVQRFWLTEVQNYIELCGFLLWDGIFSNACTFKGVSLSLNAPRNKDFVWGSLWCLSPGLFKRVSLIDKQEDCAASPNACFSFSFVFAVVNWGFANSRRSSLFVYFFIINIVSSVCEKICIVAFYGIWRFFFISLYICVNFIFIYIPS